MAHAVSGAYGSRSDWEVSLSSALRNRERLKPADDKNSPLYLGTWEEQYAALLEGAKSVSRTAPVSSLSFKAASGRVTAEAAEEDADSSLGDTTPSLIIPGGFALSDEAAFGEVEDGGVVVVGLYPGRPRPVLRLVRVTGRTEVQDTCTSPSIATPHDADGRTTVPLCSGMRLLDMALSDLGAAPEDRTVPFWTPLSRTPYVSLAALQRDGSRGNTARQPGGGRERHRVGATADTSRVATVADARDIFRPTDLTRRRKKGRGMDEDAQGREGRGAKRSRSTKGQGASSGRKRVAGKPRKGRKQTRQEADSAVAACGYFPAKASGSTGTESSA